MRAGPVPFVTVVRRSWLTVRRDLFVFIKKTVSLRRAVHCHNKIKESGGYFFGASRRQF